MSLWPYSRNSSGVIETSDERGRVHPIGRAQNEHAARFTRGVSRPPERSTSRPGLWRAHGTAGGVPRGYPRDTTTGGVAPDPRISPGYTTDSGAGTAFLKPYAIVRTRTTQHRPVAKRRA